MPGRDSRWRKVPVLVYVGVSLGGMVGVFVGNALCLGYDILYGPWFPQAGVDPQPAGWVGWWMAGGAAVGAAGGLVASVVLVGLWRLVGGSRPSAEPGAAAARSRM